MEYENVTQKVLFDNAVLDVSMPGRKYVRDGYSASWKVDRTFTPQMLEGN
jgi:hypothetical protein